MCGPVFVRVDRFLAMNKQDLGDLRGKTVTELGWCSRPVVSDTGRTRCRRRGAAADMVQ